MGARNDLWTADFEGQFRTGNGVCCYPLTIADEHSRFLPTCHGLVSTETLMTKPVFERTFREFGCCVPSARTTACRSPPRRLTDCPI